MAAGRNDTRHDYAVCEISGLRDQRGQLMTSAFRLLPIVKQGTAASMPETWTHYASIEQARIGAKLMYGHDRVQRVMVVSDNAAGSFVEWIERSP
jgi:hypothetical protein